MITKEVLDKEIMKEGFYERWSGLSKAEVAGLLGPEMAQTVGYEQNNPYHVYSLYEHMLYTVENIFPLRDEDDERQLKIAALLHDVGKPAVAKERCGRTVYYDHADASEKIADRLLGEMGYSGEEKSRILFYIRYHDAFIPFSMEMEGMKEADRMERFEKILRKLGKKEPGILTDENSVLVWKNLFILIYADIGAQADRTVMNGRLVSVKADRLRRTEWMYVQANLAST